MHGANFFIFLTIVPPPPIQISLIKSNKVLGSKLSWQSLLRGINFIPFNLLLINKS